MSLCLAKPAQVVRVLLPYLVGYALCVSKTINILTKIDSFNFKPLMMSSKTWMEIESVALKSSSSPEVHTQRKGPKPREKMSLYHTKCTHNLIEINCMSNYPMMSCTYDGYLNARSDAAGDAFLGATSAPARRASSKKALP